MPPKQLPEGKPKKPLTAYFAFGATQREGLKELPVLEQSKAIGALWSKLSPEEKDVFTKTAEREKEAYKKDLEEWYAAHPEDKLKDEEDALAKRKKLKDKAAEPGTKVSVREPRKSKASDLMSLKLLFIVANVKKYIDENQGRVLPPTKKVKAAITAQFNSLTEEGRATWTSYLEQLDDDKKSHLKAFHDAWLKFTEV